MIVSGMIWVGACVGNIAGSVHSPRLHHWTLTPQTILLQTKPSAKLSARDRLDPSLQLSRTPYFRVPSIRLQVGEQEEGEAKGGEGTCYSG